MHWVCYDGDAATDKKIGVSVANWISVQQQLHLEAAACDGAITAEVRRRS
jgi:hypothetical protein